MFAASTAFDGGGLFTLYLAARCHLLPTTSSAQVTEGCSVNPLESWTDGKRLGGLLNEHHHVS